MLNNIKNKLLTVHVFLSKLNRFKLIILAVIINILLSLLFSSISDIILGEGVAKETNNLSWSFKEKIIIILILAPIFETLFLQYSIIEILGKKFSPIVCCCISALAFALMHGYNIFYVFYAFFSGLVLAYMYYLGGSVIKGIFLTFITHFIYNSFVFTMKYLFS